MAVSARKAATESRAIHTSRPYRVFFATWAGWTLDGFDNAIYIYVIVAALTQLLPASGLPADHAHIARYGGLMFSLFMLGWACSMVWGWCADRFGRVPAMCATILIYSIFTGACGLASGIVSFAVFRFLTGFGIGGEWAAGAPLLQESVPEAMRAKLSGWLHTGTPIGFLLASATALFVLPHFGWRALFLIGAAPALLTLWLRAGVPESPKWTEQREKQEASVSWRALFSRGLARTTWCAALMMTCLIFGLWSSTFWIPTLVSTWQTSLGATPAQAQHMGSMSGFIMSVGTLAACGGIPWIATFFSTRRRAAAFFFIGAAVCNLLAYGIVVMVLKNLTIFMWMLPLLGFFTSGVFSLYTIWLPEMFPTMMRALGSGFAFSFGRIVGAVGPTLVGALAATFDSYPMAITVVSLIYVIGLPLVLFAPETAGKTLRA